MRRDPVAPSQLTGVRGRCRPLSNKLGEELQVCKTATIVTYSGGFLAVPVNPGHEVSVSIIGNLE